MIAVEFCKSANPGSYRGVSPFRCFLFGDNRGLRFSVRQLRLPHFLFSPDNILKEHVYEEKNFDGVLFGFFMDNMSFCDI